MEFQVAITCHCCKSKKLVLFTDGRNSSDTEWWECGGYELQQNGIYKVSVFPVPPTWDKPYFRKKLQFPITCENISLSFFSFERFFLIITIFRDYINWKFVNRITEQVKSFKAGFNDVIPLRSLAVSQNPKVI